MGTLKLNTTSGGSLSIQAADGASDNTLTLPAVTGGNIVTTADSGTITQGMIGSNVVGKGPAFHAYPSATTSASHSVWTKVPINTERFDTNSNFDTSTYRFTPTVAGYYSVTGMVSFGENIASVEAGLSVNGSIAYGGTANWSNNVNSMTTALIYFNGSTDYVELYAIQWSGVTKTIQNSASTVRFEAHLVRAA